MVQFKIIRPFSDCLKILKVSVKKFSFCPLLPAITIVSPSMICYSFIYTAVKTGLSSTFNSLQYVDIYFNLFLLIHKGKIFSINTLRNGRMNQEKEAVAATPSFSDRCLKRSVFMAPG